MKISGKNIEGTQVVHVAAKAIDADTAAEFARQLEPLAARGDRLLLDLAEVAFVDSTGLGAILRAIRKLADDGVGTRICRPARAVRTVMRMVGMHRVVPVYDTLEEALGGPAADADPLVA